MIKCGKCNYKWLVQGEKAPKTPQCSKCKNTTPGLLEIIPFEMDPMPNEAINAVKDAGTDAIKNIVKSELKALKLKPEDTLTGQADRKSGMDRLIDVFIDIGEKHGDKLIEGIITVANKPKPLPRGIAPPRPQPATPQMVTKSGVGVVYDPSTGRMHLADNYEAPQQPQYYEEPEQYEQPQPQPIQQPQPQPQPEQPNEANLIRMELNQDIQDKVSMVISALKGMNEAEIVNYIEGGEIVKNTKKFKLLIPKIYKQAVKEATPDIIKQILSNDSPATLEILDRRDLWPKLEQQLNEIKEILGFAPIPKPIKKPKEPKPPKPKPPKKPGAKSKKKKKK